MAKRNTVTLWVFLAGFFAYQIYVCSGFSDLQEDIAGIQTSIRGEMKEMELRLTKEISEVRSDLSKEIFDIRERVVGIDRRLTLVETRLMEVEKQMKITALPSSPSP